MQSSVGASDHNASEDFEDSEDYTSSSGSSSSGDSSDDEDATHSNHLASDSQGGRDSPASSSLPLLMPSSTGRTGTLPPTDLSSRLADFLPSLKAANESLEQDQEREGLASRTLEVADDEDEPHVDMNLALGVLEEVRESGSEDSEDTSSESEDSKEGQATVVQAQTDSKRKGGALDSLMGRKKKRPKPAIEVVGESPRD